MMSSVTIKMSVREHIHIYRAVFLTLRSNIYLGQKYPLFRYSIPFTGFR